MVEGGPAVVHDPLDMLLFDRVGQLEKGHGLVDGPHEALGVIGFKKKSAAGVVGRVQMVDGIVQAAGIMGHGQSTVDLADHLGQAAGLEQRRHEHKIRAAP